MSIGKTVKRTVRDLAKNSYHRRVSGGKIFSNFDEQRIIEKYIELFEIDQAKKSVVDIGAGDGIRRSNTYSLFVNGWWGVGFEYGSRAAAKLAEAYRYYPNAFACRCKVTPENVVKLLESYSIEKDFGILSLDIDGYDYWVLDELLTHFRPTLIVTEFNEKIPPPIRFTVNYDPDFETGHHFYGYSLASLKPLLEKHNYALLEVEYNNAFLAPAELQGVQSVEIGQAYREGYLDRPDRLEKFKPNENMEPLHSMTPADGVEFLNAFYADHKGAYEISPE